MDNLKEKIRNVPDFPKAGILFYDITTLLQDPIGFRAALDSLTQPFTDQGVELVVGIESRGFIFGSVLADRLGAGFSPVRKPGKLPSQTVKCTYDLEYGTDCLEIHNDAVRKGQRVLIVDDLLATGGTASATVNLVKQLGNRDKLFIATKTPQGSIANAKAAIDESFRRLRVDHIELLQVHNMNNSDQQLPAFREYKQSRKIRYLGVTTSQDGHYDEMLRVMRGHDLDFIQVDYSLGKISQANPTLKTQMDAESRSAVAAVHVATDRATKLVSGRGRDANAAEYFEALNGSVKSLFEMQQRGKDSLSVLLQNRISKFSGEVAATLAWAGLGLLIVSAVGLFMARDITASLRRVVDAANQIAVGDLAVQALPTSRNDERNRLATPFNNRSPTS